MSKKKNRKKHQFKHTAPPSVQTEGVQTQAMGQQGSNSKPLAPRKSSNAALAGVDNFDYVPGDIKRVAILAFGFITLQMILWYLFNHTGLGAHVYGLVKL